MYTISDQPGFKLSSNVPKSHLDALVCAKYYNDTRRTIITLSRSLNRLLESAARLNPALERDLREAIPTVQRVIEGIQEETHAQFATTEKAMSDFEAEKQRPTP